MLTPSQKLLKTRLTNVLDKMLAHVEDLKERGAETNIDRVLKEQRQRVNTATAINVLMQVSDGKILDQYYKIIDRLEDQLVEDDPESEHDIEKSSDILDDYLEGAGKDIDQLRARAEREEKLVAAATQPRTAIGMLSAALQAEGAETLLNGDTAVTALFKTKSMSERVSERRERRRWLKTPAGKVYKVKQRRLAKRPHIKDRQKAKVSRQAHKTYRY